MSKERYNQVRHDYDSVSLEIHTSYDPTAEFAEDFKYLLGELKPKDSLLIVGGIASECQFFEQKGFSVVNIDLSRSILSSIRSNSPNTKTIQANMLDWKPDKVFNGILAVRSLIHIPPSDLLDTLKNVYSLLAKGGIFSAVYFTTTGKDVQEEECPDPLTQDSDAIYYRVLYSKKYLQQKYDAVGFNIVKMTDCKDKDGDQCVSIHARIDS